MDARTTTGPPEGTRACRIFHRHVRLLDMLALQLNQDLDSGTTTFDLNTTRSGLQGLKLPSPQPGKTYTAITRHTLLPTAFPADIFGPGYSDNFESIGSMRRSIGVRAS